MELTKLGDKYLFTVPHKKYYGTIEEIRRDVNKRLNEINTGWELMQQIKQFDEVKHPIITEEMKNIIHKVTPIFEGISKITMPTIIIKNLCLEFILDAEMNKTNYEYYKLVLDNYERYL